MFALAKYSYKYINKDGNTEFEFRDLGSRGAWHALSVPLDICLDRRQKYEYKQTQIQTSPQAKRHELSLHVIFFV